MSIYVITNNHVLSMALKATQHLVLTILSFLSDWDLADKFRLNSGSQRITLPKDLETRSTYIVVLFGDSGNASPEFTIKAARHE